MQTATPSTTRPRAARLKTTAIPALMPSGDLWSSMFWPIEALNMDAQLQAIELLQAKAFTTNWLKPGAFVTRMALSQAFLALSDKVTNHFENCRDSGHLLYAWRGSKALMPTLPAGLEGGAA